MQFLQRFLSLSLFLVCLVQMANAQTIALENYATGFDDPVVITHAGDDRIFVVEQPGRIKIINADGSVNAIPFLNIASIVNSGANERGLLGLAFHPNYSQNGYFFVNYTANGGGATTIARYSVSGADIDLADPASATILMTIAQPFSNHNGGNLAFGPDGYLYIGTGDGGSANDPGNRSQDPQNLLGKMLRIDVDNGTPYGIPADNPFVGDPSTLDEIWAIGLRNPWKYSFDRMTGDLWIGDVGQNEWEEIDLQWASSTGGENYGWRCYEGNHNFNTGGCGPMSDYNAPIFEYSNNFNEGCSVTGGYVYRGSEYAGLWGKYIFADYCSGKFWASTPDLIGGGYITTEIADLSNNQYTAFGEDACGRLFVAGHGTGIIYKITETADCHPVAMILGETNVSLCPGSPLEAVCSPDLTYTWSVDGVVAANGTDATYYPTQSGTYTLEVSNGVCFASATAVNVTMLAAPAQPELTGLEPEFCANFSPYVHTLVGTPTGGIFEGAFLTGNVIDLSSFQWNPEEYLYTYTITDANGCSSTDSLMSQFWFCSSTNDYENFNSLAIEPNPSNGVFSVVFDMNDAQKVDFLFYDVAGKLVAQETGSYAAGEQSIGFELKDLPKGVYFLNAKTEDQKDAMIKFIIE